MTPEESRAYARQQVAKWPPLTPAQRADIRRVFRAHLEPRGRALSDRKAAA